MEKPTTTLFPVAYGTEEEKGMMIRVEDYIDEPYDLVARFRDFLPDGISYTGQFLTNGFKMYGGGTEGASELTNLEIATPECATPTELVRYSRASDLLLRSVVESYGAQLSDDLSQMVTMRTQRRVVDSEGNRKACHDNFGAEVTSSQLSPLLDHLASRSIVTGSGYVAPGSFRFAQKIDGLHAVSSYGYHGSMYRKSSAEGTSRFEVRCSDVNISDWATWQRIGGVALVIAISKSPFANELQRMKVDPHPIARARKLNKLPLTKDGRPQFTKKTVQAVDFQQQVAELAMDRLPEVAEDMSDEYFRLASELNRYCDDLRNVMSGKSNVELLADRADWAAKLALIRRYIDRESQFGIVHHAIDINAKMIDLKYDLYLVSANEGRIISRQEGTGYKLRARNALSNRITDTEAKSALFRAPRSTRAGIRSDILSSYVVSECDWSRIKLKNTDGDSAMLYLPDVTQAELYASDKEILKSVQAIKR